MSGEIERPAGAPDGDSERRRNLRNAVATHLSTIGYILDRVDQCDLLPGAEVGEALQSVVSLQHLFGVLDEIATAPLAAPSAAGAVRGGTPPSGPGRMSQEEWDARSDAGEDVYALAAEDLAASVSSGDTTADAALLTAVLARSRSEVVALTRGMDETTSARYFERIEAEEAALARLVALVDTRTEERDLAVAWVGEPCAECGHIDWRSDPNPMLERADRAEAALADARAEAQSLLTQLVEARLELAAVAGGETTG